MRHKSSRVREHAFRALSLFAIIDYDIAHDLCPYLRVVSSFLHPIHAEYTRVGNARRGGRATARYCIAGVV